MVLVGIAAINLAAFGTLLGENHDLRCGLAPMAFALQVANFLLIRSRGGVRAFSAGFLVCGIIATTGFLSATLSCPSESVSIDHKTGKAVVQSSGGSIIWVLWTGYGHFAWGVLNRLTTSDFILGDGPDPHGHDGIPLATRAVLLTFPQAMFAGIGGTFTSLVRRWRFKGVSHVRDQSEPASGALTSASAAEAANDSPRVQPSQRNQKLYTVWRHGR
jgi:hypothetical protein